ncbi:MAG: 2Fe-2S iron-sulfur cluster-binding protein [Alphaproteobacteria bacterium]
MTDTVAVTIQRGAAGETPRDDIFTVPYREGMSLLDALIWIRAHADPTLAFRYSCINANSCKECVVSVEGRTEYACTTRLTGGAVSVRPIGNKRLLRDLATDTVPPKEKFAAQD